MAGSTRRRRLWILHRLMAERESAGDLRSYGLREFLLDQYDRVMGAETRIQLALARRATTMSAAGSVVGGLATAGVYVLLAVLLLGDQIPVSRPRPRWSRSRPPSECSPSPRTSRPALHGGPTLP